MLKKLTIEQFVIIDRLELDFQPGLTIFTGETGAGKSILLGAMGLILGEPSDPEAIRQGAAQSVIEAQLEPPPGHPVWAFLSEHNIPASPDQGFRIHRTIKPSEDEGEPNEEILVNDKGMDRDLLQQMGTLLVEIHGQFANQSLLDPDNQLTLLDLSGGFAPEIFQNVIDALNEVRNYKKELEEEKSFLAKHKHELIGIQTLVKKFEAIGMREGLVEETLEEYATLLTAKETSEAFQAILAQLIASNGVVGALTSANRILAAQQNIDAEKLEDLTEFLAVALENAEASVDEMRRLGPEYEIDLTPLKEREKMLRQLEEISGETDIALEDLFAHYQETSTKLERIREGKKRLSELEVLLVEARQKYLKHAKILSEKRVEAGKALSASITAELPPLKLMKAEFEVEVTENENMPWTERGINEVVFTARMNPGMPFSPISETASGGELARMMLGLKVVVQAVQTIPTLVFDEVDTGIGGAAAAAVGERLALLAETTQVLVITHSPQVASRGDQHKHVSKKSDSATTTSTVRALSMDERIDEVARMLAGDKITPEAHAAAKKLIDEAREAATVRREAPPEPSPLPEEATPEESVPEEVSEPGPVAEQGEEDIAEPQPRDGTLPD